MHLVVHGIELSTVSRFIVLTILPNGHEMTVLLSNRTLKKDNDLLAITSLIIARRRQARDFLRHCHDV